MSPSKDAQFRMAFAALGARHHRTMGNAQQLPNPTNEWPTFASQRCRHPTPPELPSTQRKSRPFGFAFRSLATTSVSSPCATCWCVYRPTRRGGCTFGSYGSRPWQTGRALCPCHRRRCDRHSPQQRPSRTVHFSGYPQQASGQVPRRPPKSKSAALSDSLAKLLVE